MADKAVIFDLDGTLADTPQAITTIIIKVLAERGVSEPEHVVRATIGRPLVAGLASLLKLPAEHPKVAAAAADYQRLFREHLLGSGSELAYPGVATGLRTLRAAGLLLGVATSKPRGAARRILTKMDVAELFGSIAGDDTVHNGKPDPEMARYVAGQLGLPPGGCVVVGDGVADVGMGIAAGMRVLGVSYGVSTKTELIAAGAEQVVDSFDEIVRLLLTTTLTGESR